MLGIEGYVVRVEADSSPGTPACAIIGLPDRALNEARDRVRAAIFNSGFAYPAGRLLVNLSPADVRGSIRCNNQLRSLDTSGNIWIRQNQRENSAGLYKLG